MRLQTKANNNDKKSEKLLALVSKPGEFITAILIGNNVANILLPTLVTMLAIEYGFNVGIASAILTIVIIVFSEDRKSTRLNSSHVSISYAVFCLKKKKTI